MRITIDLPDPLFRRVKASAAASGLKLKDFARAPPCRRLCGMKRKALPSLWMLANLTDWSCASTSGAWTRGVRPTNRLAGSTGTPSTIAMLETAFFDTHLFLYAYSLAPEDRVKSLRARELFEQYQPVISQPFSPKICSTASHSNRSASSTPSLPPPSQVQVVRPTIGCIA
ncbi:MAG: hypothetical protein JJT96_18830 [Opitutales bacterium]|nr:hypothetical protein [Opitutales bacterium]